MMPLDKCLGALTALAPAEGPWPSLCRAAISTYLEASPPDRGSQKKALRLLRLASFMHSDRCASADMVQEEIALRLQDLGRA